MNSARSMIALATIILAQIGLTLSDGGFACPTNFAYGECQSTSFATADAEPQLAPASQPNPSKRRFVCPALTTETWCCIKFETLSGDKVYEYTRKACKTT
ncbi:hypothetical protein PGT21_009065 [Puccinia graminis f. sp. tritici]|nr:hypothetical protein PGT21_009065 [Puccinia graminis f. sp. tritici]